jgi:1-deoxy-D-xylulose-5-phosphate reductoisomerase
MKHIAVLGSTGSIGLSTLSIVRQFPDNFKISSLCCRSNTDLLLNQIIEFQPFFAVVEKQEDALILEKKLPKNLDTKILFGESGYKEAVQDNKTDIVLCAIVGTAGLKPAMHAICSGKDIALANKESLVAAGDLFMGESEKRNTKILPVDSEHSAIFQCMEGNSRKEVSKIFLTASGGPFRKTDYKEFKNILPEQALNHPTWSMGAKISIDSATLMNKGLEVIEAVHLFKIEPEKIDVVVHPQSIVHSMVGYIDGSIIAQMGVPDMREAISYALSWPDRLDTGFEYPDFTKLGLEFEAPDFKKFKSLQLAYEAASQGKTMPAAMNAANEEAVSAFLKSLIRFDQIPLVVEEAMNGHDNFKALSIEDVLFADEKSRINALEIINRIGNGVK